MLLPVDCSRADDVPSIIDTGGLIQIPTEHWIDKAVEIDHVAIAEEDGVGNTASRIGIPNHLAGVVNARGFAIRIPGEGAEISHGAIAEEGCVGNTASRIGIPNHLAGVV